MTCRVPALLPLRALHAGARTLVVALGLCGLVVPGWASDHDDHERARQAVQAGQVLPLRAVLERLEREHPGQVLEVELEQDDGLWMYEVKLLQSDGRLVKLRFDARNAALLDRKSRAADARGRRSDR